MKITHLFLPALFASLLLAASPAHPKLKSHIKGILPEVFDGASFDKKKRSLRVDLKKENRLIRKKRNLKGRFKP